MIANLVGLNFFLILFSINGLRLEATDDNTSQVLFSPKNFCQETLTRSALMQNLFKQDARSRSNSRNYQSDSFPDEGSIYQ